MRISQLMLPAVGATLIVGLTVVLASMSSRPPEKEPALPTPPVREANPVEKPDAAARLKALQGKWRVVDEGGPDGDAAEPFRHVNENAHTLVVIDKNEMVTRDTRGPVVIDADGKQEFAPLVQALRFPSAGGPEALDLFFVSGPAALKGAGAEAIYKLDGDRLTLCVRDVEHPRKGRPIRFEGDETQALLVLERLKDAKAELKGLAGEWGGKRFSLADDEVLTDDVKPKWVFDGDGAKFAGTGEPGESATVALDPAATPPAIDLTVTRDGKRVVLAGIYCRRGDRLTVCVAESGRERPKHVRPDVGVLLYHLERADK